MLSRRPIQTFGDLRAWLCTAFALGPTSAYRQLVVTRPGDDPREVSGEHIFCEVPFAVLLNDYDNAAHCRAYFLSLSETTCEALV